MKRSGISMTALLTAYSRSYHLDNDVPVIFEDHLAKDLLQEEEQAWFQEYLFTAHRTHNPASAAAFPDEAAALNWLMHGSAGVPLILSRARYAEEKLEEAITEGVTQYVILGAGYDSFAFRRPGLMHQLQVFEVDHPTMQRHKLSRLRELKWNIPPQLHFVPVDLTREDLAAALGASSFDPEAPTFFSWLGVTYYLPGDAVLATLCAIASIAAPGSSVIFDYLDTDAFIPCKASPRVLVMLYATGQMGEAMRSGFDPLILRSQLQSLGLCLLQDLSPAEIHMRYFLGRTDHYRACEHAHFAYAVPG